MKKLTYLFIGIALTIGLPAYAAFSDAFKSIQLAPTPSSGNCLTTNGSVNSWSSSCGSGGGGSDSNWTFFNGSGIKLATTTNQVLIGDTATTTTNGLEVKGSGIFRMYTDTANLGAETYSQTTFNPSHTKWHINDDDVGDFTFTGTVLTYSATANHFGDLYQNPEDLAVSLNVGHTYRISWTLSSVTAGDLVAEIAGDASIGSIAIANGENHLDFVMPSGFPPYFSVTGTTGGFTVSSVSLKDASQQGNLTVQNNAIVGNSLFAVNGLNLGVPGTLGTDYYQVADSAGNLYAPARNHDYEGLFFGEPGDAKFSMYSDNSTYIALRDNVNSALLFQMNKDNQIFYGSLQSGSLTFPSRFNGATGQSGFIMSGSGVQDLGLLWTGSTKTLALKNAAGSATSAWTADPGITFDSPRLTSTNSTSTNATSTNLYVSGIASTSQLYIGAGTGCLSLVAGKVTASGSACSSGGGGGANSKWATSTNPSTGIYPNGGVGTNVGIGTTTPISRLTIATSTTYTAAFPDLLIGPNGLASGSSGGTLIGANTQAGFTGNLIDLQVGGLSVFSVTGSSAATVFGNFTGAQNITANGNLVAASNLQVGASGIMRFNGRTILTASADGNLEIWNSAQTGFTRLNFGGTTSSFPALLRNSNGLTLNLADGTAGGNFAVGTTTPTWTMTVASTTPVFELDDTDGATNQKHIIMGNYSGTFSIGTSSDTSLTSTSTALSLTPGVPAQLLLGTSTNAVNTASVLATQGTVYMGGLTASAGLQTGVVCLDANNQLINDSVACIASSRRFKYDIHDLNPSLKEVLSLNPVTFRYTPEFNGALQNNPNYNGEQVGFIAEEVQAIDPRLVVLETSGENVGKPHTVRYENLTALLTSAIQELWHTLTNHESRLDKLEKENVELKARLDALEKK